MKDTNPYITVTFHVKEDQETGQYMAECQELGVASAGEDLDEAFRNIREATELYLETLESTGERSRVLAEKGLQIRHGPSEPEVLVSLSARPEEYVSPENLPLAV